LGINLVRSMRRSPLVGLFAFAISAQAQTVRPTPTLSPTPPFIKVAPGAQLRKAKALAVNAPRPEYPPEARKHHWVGVGWFAMHVDESTGVVTSVDILQSTGHNMLDRSCVDTLKKWRFVPHSGLKTIKTPITFAMPVDKT